VLILCGGNLALNDLINRSSTAEVTD